MCDSCRAFNFLSIFRVLGYSHPHNAYIIYCNLKLTQKEEVRGRVADELYEGFPHGLWEVNPGAGDVADGVEGEDQTDPDNLHGLEDHVHLTEARQPLVPHAGQQLLDVGVSDKLIISSQVE